MTFSISTALLMIFLNSITLFNFESDSNMNQWRVVDDVVMGGRSQGTFQINAQGHGVFKGYVSLENNGGFSSIRYRNSFKLSPDYKTVAIRLKGDGKKYQFRIKHRTNQWESYIYNFQTTGDWEIIEIPLKEMYPSFRGRKLNKNNFNFDRIEEMGFLISNKTNEQFKLIIDAIKLKS